MLRLACRRRIPLLMYSQAIQEQKSQTHNIQIQNVYIVSRPKCQALTTVALVLDFILCIFSIYSIYVKQLKGNPSEPFERALHLGLEKKLHRFCICRWFLPLKDMWVHTNQYGKCVPHINLQRIRNSYFFSRYDQSFIENAIKWTNVNYGGKGLKVSRVIFVNGSIDPWHALGLTTQNGTSRDNLVIFIEGTVLVGLEIGATLE